MTYTPDPSVVSLLVGHFREDGSYRTVRPAGATSWLLIVTVAGRGSVSGPGGIEEFGPGEAALLAPRHPHAYRTAEETRGWEIRWAHFHPRPEWSALMTWPEIRPGLRRASLGADAEATFASLETARRHGERGADPYEERLALAALESALVRVRRAAAETEATGDPRVRVAVTLALRHLREPIGPEEMARAAGLSPSRLGVLFRAEMGVSPRAFLERLRMDRARSLLTMTDLTVRAISEEVGFASEFYFSNRFRQGVGVPPSVYRGLQAPLEEGSG